MKDAFETAWAHLPGCCCADPLATKTVEDCVWLARFELDMYEEQQDGCCTAREAAQLRKYIKRFGTS